MGGQSHLAGMYSGEGLALALGLAGWEEDDSQRGGKLLVCTPT